MWVGGVGTYALHAASENMVGGTPFLQVKTMYSHTGPGPSCVNNIQHRSWTAKTGPLETSWCGGLRRRTQRQAAQSVPLVHLPTPPWHLPLVAPCPCVSNSLFHSLAPSPLPLIHAYSYILVSRSLCLPLARLHSFTVLLPTIHSFAVVVRAAAPASTCLSHPPPWRPPIPTHPPSCCCLSLLDCFLSSSSLSSLLILRPSNRLTSSLVQATSSPPLLDKRFSTSASRALNCPVFEICFWEVPFLQQASHVLPAIDWYWRISRAFYAD